MKKPAHFSNTNQLGFTFSLIVILLTAIIGSLILVIKNITFNQPKPASSLIQQSTASAQIKSSPTSTVSKKVNSTLTTTSFSSTNNSNTSNNSSSNNNIVSATNSPTPANSSTPTMGTLKGTIKDSNGTLLANASFQISCSSCNNLRNGMSQDEQADGSGNFTVNNLPTIALSVKPFYGHWGDAQTVTIIGGQTTTVNLVVGADTTAKPIISITKGPYSSGVQTSCFDVRASQTNCYQLNATYTTDNGSYSTANLSSGGACIYTGTICTNVAGSHTFKVKAYTVSTNTYSDEVSDSYTYP